MNFTVGRLSGEMGSPYVVSLFHRRLDAAGKPLEGRGVGLARVLCEGLSSKRLALFPPLFTINSILYISQ